ncbi:hypothetical protein ACFVH6_01220 [Spirillospora sp. NPDC127200]
MTTTTSTTSTALRRGAAVGGLAFALGAGALGTAASASASAAPAQDGASAAAVSVLRPFDVCAPSVRKCSTAPRLKVRAKGKFTFTRTSIRGTVKATEQTSRRATFTVTYHLRTGTPRTTTFTVNRSLNRAFGYPSGPRAIKKIVVKACDGAVCGKPQTIAVPAF